VIGFLSFLVRVVAYFRTLLVAAYSLNGGVNINKDPVRRTGQALAITQQTFPDLAAQPGNESLQFDKVLLFNRLYDPGQSGGYRHTLPPGHASYHLVTANLSHMGHGAGSGGLPHNYHLDRIGELISRILGSRRGLDQLLYQVFQLKFFRKTQYRKKSGVYRHVCCRHLHRNFRLRTFAVL